MNRRQLHLMLCEDMKRPQHHPENFTVQPHFALRVPEDEFRATVLRLKNANILLDNKKNTDNKTNYTGSYHVTLTLPFKNPLMTSYL